jgi:hypothetical protein
MKIALASDLHLEFGDLYLNNDHDVDVLILGGDIFVVNDLYAFVEDDSAALIPATSVQKAAADRYFNFIRNCLENFPKVVYIMGNHEHYHGDFANTAKQIREIFEPFNNFVFLDNDHAVINDHLFFGGTLWTDMNKEDPITMWNIRRMMNDFNCIKNGVDTGDKYYSTFTPEDAVEEHYKFRRNLDNALFLYPDLPVVVVGHHAPSHTSVHPRYKHDVLINGGYTTDMDQFILDRPRIKLWTHGHTHEDFDYMIGTTRIVCNPRGYDGYEARADNFKLKYVEI